MYRPFNEEVYNQIQRVKYNSFDDMVNKLLNLLIVDNLHFSSIHQKNNNND